VDQQRNASTAAMSPRRKWDGVAALIAALIGVLALFVSGYTAYVQRQQVRAQVWPYLLAANYDPEFSIKVLNKGVGPAIVRSMQVWVDGQPQRDWKHVMAVLGLPASSLRTSTVNDNVVSANETVAMLVFPDQASYRGFRDVVHSRFGMEICYCSTLEECWMYSDRKLDARPTQSSVAKCPRLATDQAFDD
jgi:hypothetical protein